MDAVRWPHTSTCLHLLEMHRACETAGQGLMARVYWAALDRLEGRLMKGVCDVA